MWQRRPLVTSYRIMWVAIPAVFLAVVAYLLFVQPAGGRFAEVDRREVRLATDAPDDLGQQHPSQPPEPSQLNVEDAEVTVASADGYLKMHLWADRLAKDGPAYAVEGGLMQFETENGDTLLIEITSADYRTDDDIMTITGELRGIVEREQLQFTAREVVWDQRGNKLLARQVGLAGPVVNVTGQEMELDMLTGIVRFNGQVKAGL